MSKHDDLVVRKWPRLSRAGRRDLRGWYRVWRRVYGLSVPDARTVVGFMAHSAIMGDYWLKDSTDA